MKTPAPLSLPCLAIALSFTWNAPGEETAIRNLPIEAIESLGQELYIRDSLAAAGSDLLFSRIPDARNMKFGGWITEIREHESRVYMFKRVDDAIAMGYIVTFPAEGEPKVENHETEEIPEEIQIRLKARSTAIQSIPGFYDRPYNFEVLDDPDGDGFIVYSLAATSDPNEIVVGGHTRVTVSNDGTKAESVDSLSKSLFILPKSTTEQGENVQGYTVSHIVSATPVETHVLISLMHKLPVFVATGTEEIWKVEEGTIEKMENEDPAAEPSRPQPQ